MTTLVGKRDRPKNVYELEIHQLLWLSSGAWFHKPGFAARARPIFYMGLQRPVLGNRF
jgi:hypothetical protein